MNLEQKKSSKAAHLPAYSTSDIIMHISLQLMSFILYEENLRYLFNYTKQNPLASITKTNLKFITSMNSVSRNFWSLPVC